MAAATDQLDSADVGECLLRPSPRGTNLICLTIKVCLAGIIPSNATYFFHRPAGATNASATLDCNTKWNVHLKLEAS